MPKKNTEVVDDLDDRSIEIDLKPRNSRNFDGSDESPLDADTGESLFDDVDPRLRELGSKPRKDTDPDDDDLDDPDEDPEDEPEPDPEPDDLLDDPDEEPEPPRKRGGWTRRLDRANRRIEEVQSENDELRARLDRIERTSQLSTLTAEWNTKKASFEADIAKAEKELEDAIEEGDSKAQSRLTRELNGLQVELKAGQIAYDRQKESAEIAAKEVRGGQQAVVARKAAEWIRKHPRYNTSPAFKGAVQAMDKVMGAEGLDPTTDEYYRELDRRLAKEFPAEFKRGRREAREERDDPPPRRRHPSAGVRREGTTQTRKSNFDVRGGKLRLTPSQVETMREFGLDPKNAQHVRAYFENNR